MAEITRVYKQSVPAMRFIGRKYGDEDRVHGNFGAKWEECFEGGLFETLEQLVGEGIPGYEECGAYVGLMRWKEGEPFQYWIGMFAPENTSVPDGLDYVDFPASDLGVCWVYGYEHEVYGREEECAVRLIQEGYELRADQFGAYWFFERYVCPRFTIPDQDGKITLDICQLFRSGRTMPVFREAELKDYEQVVRLKRQVHSIHVRARPEFYKPIDIPAPFEQFQADLNRETGGCYVLSENEIVLGYAVVNTRLIADHPVVRDQKIMFIDEFCIDEKHRGKGLGAELFRQLEILACSQDCDAVELDVWMFNEPARTFYAKMGMESSRMRMRKALQQQGHE